MKLIFFLVRYSPRSVVLAVLASSISGFSNVGLLSVLNAALRAAGKAPARLVWSFIALCLFLPLSRFTTEVLLTRIAQGALYDLRLKISRQILSTPLRRLEEFGIRRLMTTLTDDIPVITGTLSMLAVLGINAAVVTCGLIYLGWLSWVVLTAVLVLMAVAITIYQLAVVRAIAYYRLARLDGDALFGHFRALTTGIKELKLHRRRRQSFINQVLSSTAASARGHNNSGAALYSLAASCGQALMYSIIGIVLFGLPRVQGLNAQILIGYTLTLLFIMTPLQVIMNTFPNLGKASVAFDRVDQLGLKLATSGTEEDTRSLPPCAPAIERLELTGVSHTYWREGEDKPFRLGPIDLTLASGELLFLVGGNGTGKTTLAKIISGLYIPETGQVLLNGQSITDENREYYREHFSMVFSDFFLFDSLLGLEHPQLDSQARNYLSRLQLDHKVEVKDGAISTMDLSHGQRKRLALLTAYLEDRPIYIFDEWAADQDPQFKEVFYKQLLPELKAKRKAIIVISHDDHYYYVADRIIKLDYGKVDNTANMTLLQSTAN
jgi:putative ATP-binding cassette transporter